MRSFFGRRALQVSIDLVATRASRNATRWIPVRLHVRTHVCVRAGGASLASLRSARLVPILIVEFLFEIMFAFMVRFYGFDSLIRCIDSGHVRIHCLLPIVIALSWHRCVPKIAFPEGKKRSIYKPSHRCRRCVPKIAFPEGKQTEHLQTLTQTSLCT